MEWFFGYACVVVAIKALFLDQTSEAGPKAVVVHEENTVIQDLAKHQRLPTPRGSA